MALKSAESMCFLIRGPQVRILSGARFSAVFEIAERTGLHISGNRCDSQRANVARRLTLERIFSVCVTTRRLDRLLLRVSPSM